jgi:hypothetical protein
MDLYFFRECKVYKKMASFNRNCSQPSVPQPREIRQAIQDMQSGRIDTTMRYGRKQVWNNEESSAYIKTILKGDGTDPISVNRARRPDGSTVEHNVNGNNRCRSILKFKNNEIGVVDADEEGRECTYYYDSIPAALLASPRSRDKCKVLDLHARNKFLEYPLLFSIRENLTEAEQIEWYKALNRSLKPHTAGHMLVATICDPDNEFANDFLATFPSMKSRVNEELTDADRGSLGCFLSEITGVEVDPMNTLDTRENVLLKHAVIFNIIMNGKPFYHEFMGVRSPTTLFENANTIKRIFINASISDELKEEMAGPTKTKSYLPRLYDPVYLLGPMAYSLATNQPYAEEIWTRFLHNYQAGMIDRVYVKEVAKRKHGDETPAKYKYAWTLLKAYFDNEIA